jgi:hypothetical protein
MAVFTREQTLAFAGTGIKFKPWVVGGVVQTIEVTSGGGPTSPFQAADNSTPIGRGIPKGIGVTGRKGEVIIDPDHFGGVRFENGKQIVTLVLGFQDTDLGGPSSLLWLKANEQFIFRAQTPLRAPPSEMIVYDGTQTAVDPTILAALGATETTMWPGMAYIVLKDFDVTPSNGQLPVFLGAWATDATEVASSTTASINKFGAYPAGYNNAAMCVDYTNNLAYQTLAGNAGDPIIISTIDICTGDEVNRVTASHTYSTAFSDYPYYATALEGSNYIVVHAISKVAIADNSIYGLRMINARTGTVVASLDAVYHPDTMSPINDGYFEPGIWGSVLLRSDSTTTYLVLCNLFANVGILPADVQASEFIAVIADVTNGTLQYIVHPEYNPIRGITGPSQNPQAFTVASISDDSRAVVYWFESGSRTQVYKATLTESGATDVSLVYTHGVTLRGIGYDAIDNALILVDSTHYITKYDLDTSTQTYAVDQSAIAGASSLWMNIVTDSAYWTGFHIVKPGFGIVMRGNNDMYLCDFSDGSLSLLSSNTNEYGVFDQYRGVVIYPHSTDGLIKFDTLGDLTPNSIDGTEIITSLMTYNGDYVAGDLTFTNFPGGEAEGLDVSFDTTIDALMRDVSDTLGIREVHDDGKVKFSIPLRDGAFAIDVTLTDNDIAADGIQQFIEDEDSAFARAIIGYSDIDADFNRVTQEYARPNGSYTVLKSNKRRNIETALVMTSVQASKAAQRLTYESDLNHTVFEMAIMPAQFSVEPTAITQFNYGPNAEMTIVGEVRKATLYGDLSQTLQISEYLQAIESTFAGTALVTIAPPCKPFTPTTLTVLDTALLSYNDDLGGAGLRGYVLMSGTLLENLTNSVAYVSETGTDYGAIGTRSGIAPIGGAIEALTGTLPNGFQTDFVNTMDVFISSGDVTVMASTDEAGRYSLVNFAAIGAPGRWVLISYEDVSVSGQIATLSNIVWGVRGTEVYIDQLVVGDEFHNLESSEYIRYGSSVSTLDAELFYKAGYVGFSLRQLITVKNTTDGEAEKPYASVQFVGVDNAGDVDLTCQYRERLDPFPVMTGAKAAGYSDGTNFEWEIWGGSPSVLKRTLTSTTNAVTYAAADFVTDFGSPTPASFTARVYHMSDLGMRGHRAEATITP